MFQSSKPLSTMAETAAPKLHETAGDDYFQGILNDVFEKLREDPSKITTEDARRLSENAVAGDLRTAKIISAVEAFAAASEVINEVDPQLGQAPHTSLLTVVNDLRVAVDRNPSDVTTEILKTAQTVVSSKSSTRRMSLCIEEDELNITQRCKRLLATPMLLILS
jgi:hypothetical protein